jgi:hypothetical protein
MSYMFASNLIFHGCMKHVKFGYHFVCDQISKKLLDVRFISPDDQMTDCFTKALSQDRLLEFQCNLNLIKNLVVIEGIIKYLNKSCNRIEYKDMMSL